MEQQQRTRGKALAILIVLAGVTGVLIDGSFKIVPPGHRGVRVTMGRVGGEPFAEGLAWKIPLVSDIQILSIQQQTHANQAQCYSRDLQTVQVDYAVLYRLPETMVVPLYRDFSGEPYPSLIQPRAQESLKQVAALYPAEELVRQREAVRAEVLQRLRSAIGGAVEIVDLNIINFDLTDELEHSIEAKMVQQQKALAKTYELEREQKQAEITLVQARAEAEAMKVKAEALAANPRIIELELLKKWDGKAPQTLVTNCAGGIGLVLPVTPERR